MLGSLLVRGVSRLSLACTLIMSGLMVCIFVPQTTEVLSRLTSVGSTFGASADTMAKASLTTRDYAFGLIGSEGLKNSLEMLGLPANGLDTSMLTHLQACTPIFESAGQLFLLMAVISCVMTGFTAFVGGKNAVSRLLFHSSILAIAVIVAFGAWVFFSFDSFFTWMHSLFFPSGSWIFSADSLLICMYPENFWIGMGVVWGMTTLIASLALIVVSRLMAKRR